MGRDDRSILQNIDWVLVGIFLVMVLFGWMNIYAAVYNDEHKSILDFTQNYGKQSIWIVCALFIALMVLVIDGKFYAAFSYAIYVVMILLLLSTFAFAKNVKGSYGWIDIGAYKLQPAEFAKFATNMALAKFLSTLDTRMQDFKTKLISLAIIGIPAIIILLQNDTGSALVFGAFVLVLYREGLSGNILLLGLVSGALFVLALLIQQTTLFIVIGIIALLILMVVRRNKKNIFTIVAGALVAMAIVFSVDYFYNSVLQDHQRIRIDVLLGKEVDLKGAGYNVNQSKIAIGSGGFFGKGFLKGTQTKYDFVPEQSTDFI
ncbi:MAG: rod shape-determining protein RodA, partial [Bacteroidota bacterium]